MKFLLIATFALGIYAGTWMTGNTITVDTLIAQKCGANNTSEVVLLNNVKVSNPLGKVTCGHKDTLNKGAKALDKSINTVDKTLDILNRELDDKNGSGTDVDSIGFGF